MKDLTKEEFNNLINKIKGTEHNSLSNEDIATRAGIKLTRFRNAIYGKVKNTKEEVRKLANTFPYLRTMIPEEIFLATEEEVDIMSEKMTMLHQLIESKDEQIEQLKKIIELKDRYESGLEDFSKSLIQIIKEQGEMKNILKNFTKSYKPS